MIIENLTLDKAFVISRSNQGPGKGYQLIKAKAIKAEVDNFFQDLDYSGYHEN